MLRKKLALNALQAAKEAAFTKIKNDLRSSCRLIKHCPLSSDRKYLGFFQFGNVDDKLSTVRANLLESNLVKDGNFSFVGRNGQLVEIGKAETEIRLSSCARPTSHGYWELIIKLKRGIFEGTSSIGFFEKGLFEEEEDEEEVNEEKESFAPVLLSVQSNDVKSFGTIKVNLSITLAQARKIIDEELEPQLYKYYFYADKKDIPENAEGKVKIGSIVQNLKNKNVIVIGEKVEPKIRISIKLRDGTRKGFLSDVLLTDTLINLRKMMENDLELEFSNFLTIEKDPVNRNRQENGKISLQDCLCEEEGKWVIYIQ